mmetsp:Transcript_59840/g.175565  ORF Transcript_59840/g.175565 Transcript_59840/m.175565 type:complete len:610 (-) Transcript_59840:223-2052(-)
MLASLPRCAKHRQASPHVAEPVLDLLCHSLQLHVARCDRTPLLGAEVDVAHGLVNLAVAERGHARVREGERLAGEDVGQDREGAPQLDLHEGERLRSLARLEDAVPQLHRQASRAPTPPRHLLRDPLARLLRPSGHWGGLDLLGARVELWLRRGSEHDLRVDAGGHQGPLQVLEDLLAHARRGIVVRGEDEVADDRVLAEDPEVLREERRVEPGRWALGEGGHPLGDGGLQVLQRPDHACGDVAHAPLERRVRHRQHELGGDVLPALVPVHAGTTHADGGQHQPLELLRRRVREAHRHLHLGQEALPRGAAVQRHVRPGDLDLVAQVRGVALHAVEVGEEVRGRPGHVLRLQLLVCAAEPLSRRLGEVAELVLQRQRARGAARSAADHVLKGASEGESGGPRVAQHLVLGLAVLDVPRLALRPRHAHLQTVEALEPLRHPLAAKDREAVLQGPRGRRAAERGGRERVAARRQASGGRADERRALQPRVEAAAEVQGHARLEADQHVRRGAEVLRADLLGLGLRGALRLGCADRLGQVDDVEVAAALRREPQAQRLHLQAVPQGRGAVAREVPEPRLGLVVGDRCRGPAELQGEGLAHARRHYEGRCRLR